MTNIWNLQVCNIVPLKCASNTSTISPPHNFNVHFVDVKFFRKWKQLNINKTFDRGCHNVIVNQKGQHARVLKVKARGKTNLDVQSEQPLKRSAVRINIYYIEPFLSVKYCRGYLEVAFSLGFCSNGIAFNFSSVH